VTTVALGRRAMAVVRVWEGGGEGWEDARDWGRRN
jgi:hypothetical protein